MRRAARHLHPCHPRFCSAALQGGILASFPCSGEFTSPFLSFLSSALVASRTVLRDRPPRLLAGMRALLFPVIPTKADSFYRGTAIPGCALPPIRYPACPVLALLFSIIPPAPSAFGDGTEAKESRQPCSAPPLPVTSDQSLLSPPKAPQFNSSSWNVRIVTGVALIL
jgi:hypothetical protein